MPIYDFVCGDCQNDFEVITKYEKRNESIKCSKCGGLARLNPILTCSFSGNAKSNKVITEKKERENNNPPNMTAGIITPRTGNFHIENCSIRGFPIGVLDGRVNRKDLTSS